MTDLKVPRPSVAFPQQVNEVALSPMVAVPSGELRVTQLETPIGSPIIAGRIKDVWMSIGASGNTADSYPLQVSGEVFINGVSALSTKMSINHISGEASQQKTTKVTGDTGITQAVIDQDANSVVPGDVITYTLTVDRTATPTIEMSNLVVVVELEPLGLHRRS